MCKIPNAAGINISVIGHDKIPVPLSKSTALTFSRRYLLVYTCKFGSTLVKYRSAMLLSNRMLHDLLLSLTPTREVEVFFNFYLFWWIR